MQGKNAYEEQQINAFSALVKDGTYSEKFDHSPDARKFFNQVLSSALTTLTQKFDGGLRAIDCGCGNGTWMDYLLQMTQGSTIGALYGFDLTPEMVGTAMRRLANYATPTFVQPGNILDGNSYRFGTQAINYELMFTYDVVQQLPVKLQFQACESMLAHLAPGGMAVIFDNDKHSAFGSSMARKKFLTKYFGIPLVPRYYCNARYPPLQKFANTLSSDHPVECRIIVSDSGVKRALVVRSML